MGLPETFTLLVTFNLWSINVSS